MKRGAAVGLVFAALVCAGVAVLIRGSAQHQPPSTVQDMLVKEGALDEKCKDGRAATAAEIEATQKSCAARDRIYSELTARGWCYGEGKEYEYQKDWQPCRKSPAEARVSSPRELSSTVASKLTPSEEAQSVVLAKGMMASPGAIICPDFKTVGIAYGRFVDYIRDGIVRQHTSLEHQKQLELLNGKQPAADYPDISIYNCALVPPGTELHVNRTNAIPFVAGILANGQVVRGVTNPAMIEEFASHSPPNQPDGQAAVGSPPSDDPKETSGQ